MKFVDPRNDIAFKKIFGSEHHPEILISFLNAVLDLHNEDEIQEVTLLNPYQTPTVEALKYTLLDIRATDRRGRTFIVEMQVAYVAGFTKRFLYYPSRAYASQLGTGEDYTRLNTVIFVGILDFVAFPGASYVSRHAILNRDTHRQELTDLEFAFIELPKFTRREDELESLLDQWTYFIKHARNLEVIPTSAAASALRAAYEVANQFSWNSEDLEVYEQRGIRIQDERGAIQAGIERGRYGQAKETARKMLADGIAPTLIARYTGLTPEDVTTLGMKTEPEA